MKAFTLKYMWLGWVAIAAVLLSACISRGVKELDSNQAWLKSGVAVTLPAPNYAHPFMVQQLLSAKFNGQEHSLMTVLEVKGDGLALVGLSTVGIRLFKLNYTESGIITEQSIIVPEIPEPTQVLADIMLAYWPLEDWHARLPQGWSLLEEGQQRQLFDEKGELVSEVTYMAEPVEEGAMRHPILVRHLVFGYEIELKNLD